MKTDDYDYALPHELIAQHPPAARDGGRLLRLHRRTGERAHHQLLDLPRLLPPGCLLIVNDSKVFPARLAARRRTGGKVELLLLERLAPRRWRAMSHSSKRLHEGEELLLAAGHTATLRGAPSAGRCEVELADDALIAQLGEVPLPPYIDRPPTAADRERYQTVYARDEGSIAAPTAGLHLSRRLLRDLEEAGVAVLPITLHVGPGTFVPVRTADPAEHRMEAERYEVPAATATAIAAAKADGRAVVAVGTTVVRTLESTGGEAGRGNTELFIRPGHRFSVVDGLLTNFHLPRSTLVMLVCAFAGRERLLAAYREAIARRYRFYSYGDAMLVL